MFKGILIISFIFLGIPLLVGTLYADERGDKSLGFLWACGQMTLWALFFFISLPLILARIQKGVTMIMLGFGCLMAVLAVVSFVRLLQKQRWRKLLPVFGKERHPVLMTSVVLLLILQIGAMIFLAYEEGDDAFYVAVSAISASADTMYQVLPYTGYGSGVLDARHALAPFPIWISVLSRWSGLPVAVLAHVVLPIGLLCMSYGIYAYLGRLLYGEDRKRRLTFFLLLEVLVIFGGQSLYTAENFLLVRTAQGKAVLAAIVLPFLLVQGFAITRQLGEGRRIAIRDWCPVILAQVVGCLCSTQGAVLVCMFTCVVGCCQAVCYKRWRVLIPVAAGCVVPVGIMLLYLVIH